MIYEQFPLLKKGLKLRELHVILMFYMSKLKMMIFKHNFVLY